MEKLFCLMCDKNVMPEIKEVTQYFDYEDIQVEYLAKKAYCPKCGEELLSDEILTENVERIKEIYKLQNEIITIDEINEILKKYDIGKRPLSLLLGFGEITITRYLNGYVPTLKNSKELKKILNSPSYYYSVLTLNSDKIKGIAYKKSIIATKKLLNIKSEDQNIENISKYIINKIDVTNMSLQKILYYIQVFYYGLFDKQAFISRCNAWEYGPVFGNIYYKYKKFGKNIIIDEEPSDEIEGDIKQVTDYVIKYFGCYTGVILKEFTHKEEPWINSIKNDNKIIEKTALKNFGQKIIKNYDIKNVSEINKYSQKLILDYVKEII